MERLQSVCTFFGYTAWNPWKQSNKSKSRHQPSKLHMESGCSLCIHYPHNLMTYHIVSNSDLEITNLICIETAKKGKRSNGSIKRAQGIPWCITYQHCHQTWGQCRHYGWFARCRGSQTTKDRQPARLSTTLYHQCMVSLFMVTENAMFHL